VANIKSQIKRNRQNDKKRLRNRVYRGEARIAVRDARNNIEEGAPESKAALLDAISALDKAAEQGVIHKNNAARRKSRLMKAFSKMEPAPVEAELSAEAALLAAEADTVPAKGGKKAAPKKTAAKTGKAVEPAVEAVAGSKTDASKAKKPAAKPSTKAKKTETKSPAKAKTPAPKKTSPKKVSSPKKPAAKK
jgi:small subunit ribosomal protein S20